MAQTEGKVSVCYLVETGRCDWAIAWCNGLKEWTVLHLEAAPRAGKREREEDRQFTHCCGDRCPRFSHRGDRLLGAGIPPTWMGTSDMCIVHLENR
jgi:hypothetical protein